jgi:hypothetical protein
MEPVPINRFESGTGSIKNRFNDILIYFYSLTDKEYNITDLNDTNPKERKEYKLKTIEREFFLCFL